AGLLAMVAFGSILIAIGVRRSMVRSRRLYELQYGMEDLRAANQAVTAALDSTKRQMAEATLAIAQKSDAREKKITGELQIIEGLIRGFASNVTNKTQQQALPAARPSKALSAPGTDPAMLEIIRNALEENRVDLDL